MKSPKLAALLVAGAIGLAGCVDETTPLLTPDAGSARFAQAGNGVGRYIVDFGSGGVPADFGARVAALGGTVESAHGSVGLAVVSGLSPKGASSLAGSSGVSSVQADEILPLEAPAGLQLDEGVAVTTTKGKKTTTTYEPLAETPASPDNPAGAARFGFQWHMRTIGADRAWAAGHLGSSNVTIAILDTGIDYLHVDTRGRVDLQRSASMLTSYRLANGQVYTENDSVAKYFPDRLPFTDMHFHGTHVGATVSSNASVAAGVTSKTTLMAIKVCGYAIGCPFSAIINGLMHAVDNGADVANLSLGGTFAKAGNGFFVGYINKVYNHAKNKGMTIVVSAGNSSIDMDHDGNSYKTYCSTPATICISATGPTGTFSRSGPWTDIDAPAVYTNYGSSAINVAAPGGNTGGFVFAACSSTSMLIPVCQTARTFGLWVAGTSMASPHVSGLASLMVERYGRDPGQIRAAIQQSADDLGASGTDPFYGKGRINVAKAVGVN